MLRENSLEKMNWKPRGSSSSKGPLRLLKFCLLSILLPITFLCIPLYMRYKALGPTTISISSSDMKLLNEQTKISTFWCESQEIQLFNGTLNAYLVYEKPNIMTANTRKIQLNRQMILKDDMKEYWAFYLLSGSIVSLHSCSRHEGANILIVKSFKDAKRCTYLGDLDSIENSEEERIRTHYLRNQTTDTTTSTTTNNNFQDLLSKKKILDTLLLSLRNNNSSRTKRNSSPRENEFKNTEYSNLDTHKYELILSKRDKDDVQSSISSSEESLSECEGILYHIVLDGSPLCTNASNFSETSSLQTQVSFQVEDSGLYYFIFENENEITDNFVSAHFDFNKTYFNLTSSVINCTNESYCNFPFDFWSYNYIILEVPEEEEKSSCEGLQRFSSLSDCHHDLIVESICKPRSAVYLVFFLMVPVSILLFANI